LIPVLATCFRSVEYSGGWNRSFMMEVTQMGTLEGTIAITGLPPHRGLIVNLCFFRVAATDAPGPHGGDPPAEAATDCHEVVKQVDLNTETEKANYELPFAIERPAGFFYLQVRAILFRVQAGKVVAQVEPFFFRRRPLQVVEGPQDRITLPVAWPGVPLYELHHDGTVHPRSKDKT